MTTSGPGGQAIDRSILPVPDRAFAGAISRTLARSKPDYAQPIQPPEGAPNVRLVLVDDAGFGNPPTFGGPVQTPALERLAQEGLRHHATGFGSIAESSVQKAAHQTKVAVGIAG
ncbi:MAG: hypothetical protein ACXVAG_04835 [Vulcanimicrobiaceae bacterium]